MPGDLTEGPGRGAVSRTVESSQGGAVTLISAPSVWPPGPRQSEQVERGGVLAAGWSSN